MRPVVAGRATNLNTLVARTAMALEVPSRATKAIVEQLLYELAAELCAGNDVYLRRLGRFAFRDQAANLDFYRARGVALPGEDEGEVRVRICRFALVRRLRRQVNGLVVAAGDDSRDADQDALRRLRARRLGSGITLAEIVDRLNGELDDGLQPPANSNRRRTTS